MSRRTLRIPELYATVALLYSVALFGLFCWRASLPNNRERPGLDFVVFETDGVPYYLPRGTNEYDNIVGLVTAQNFVRQGFLRTHLLPDRKGVPQASLHDVPPHTQCEALSPAQNVQIYWNGVGQTVRNTALNNDCIYIHYPPLADWVFGGLAVLGLDRVVDFKVVAIFFSCATLLAFFFWMRREVSAPAALVALVLAGTLPASARWADALYYHSLQYLFLACGMLSWSRHLRTRGRGAYWLTWCLYFCEALTSFELTICFGVVLTGLTLADTSGGPLRARARRLALQAVAPLAAFALHVCLSASLIGTTRALANLGATMTARVTNTATPDGIGAGIRALVAWVGDDLLPWTLASTGLVLVVAVRRLVRAPLRRPLFVLGTLLAGSVSFWIAFPGTATAHNWMMYRHATPCVVFLLALVADALVVALQTSRGSLTAGVLVLACSAHLGWVAHRNVVQARHEVRWNVTRNRVVDPGNLVRRHLDVLYWSEGVPARARGLQRMPVSGLRVNEPPAWLTDFRMLGPEPSNYEVWWLNDESIKRVRLLADQPQVSLVIDHCAFSFFDGHQFRAIAANTVVGVTPFLPALGEQAAPKPYAWVSYSMPTAMRARAVRLTCSGVDSITLRQLEAFAN